MANFSRKLGYNYYDTPEGQDCFKKVVYTGKLATALGLAAGGYDVLMYSNPKGVLPTLARFGFYVGPLVGMATTFTTTVYISTNIRKKDDTWNYFFGGVASGGIFGAWAKNPGIGLTACAVLGIAAVIKKISKEEGFDLFPQPRWESYGTVRSHRYDFSLIPNRPGNWTRGDD